MRLEYPDNANEGMTMYELNNMQRRYFGLDPIEPHWHRMILGADAHRPESILYLDGDTIKRQIISSNKEYREYHYNEPTRNREVLLPKTSRGKEQRLNAANFERRTPLGIYLLASEYGSLTVGSFTSQTSFYQRLWEQPVQKGQSPADLVDEFIRNSPEDHFEEIEAFKQQRRRNLRFKKGDYFRFKLNRTEFGFGRVLLDIGKLQKSGALPAGHKLFALMGKPVLVQLFVFASEDKAVSIETLEKQPVLPSSVMMDNALVYGEYEVFAQQAITDEAYDFPMSFYSPSLYGGDHDSCILQWGLIHLEMSADVFNGRASAALQTTIAQHELKHNTIGFSPAYDNFHVLNALKGMEIAPDDRAWEKDLRNPKWQQTRDEIMSIFGLDSAWSYVESCKKLGLMLPGEL